MGLFKRFSVQRSNGDVLGEFNTAEAADKFQAIMTKKNEQCLVVTKDEDVQDELIEGPVSYDIEGLEQIEPDNTFGSDLDQFNDDPLGDFDTQEPDSEEDYES